MSLIPSLLGEAGVVPFSVTYCLACAACYVMVRAFSKHVIPGVNKLKPRDQLFWFNRGTSALHASIMFFSTIWYWVSVNPERKIAVCMDSWQQMCVDAMIGYLVYDTAVELFLVPGLDVLVLLHHLLGLASHIVTRALGNGYFAYWSMLVYLAEASTPLIHVSWLLYQLQLTNTFTFTVLSALILFVFFWCRIVLSPYVLYLLFTSKDAVLASSEAGATTPLSAFLFQALVIVGFTSINFFWYFKLWTIVLAKSGRQRDQAINAHVE